MVGKLGESSGGEMRGRKMGRWGGGRWGDERVKACEDEGKRGRLAVMGAAAGCQGRVILTHALSSRKYIAICLTARKRCLTGQND